MNKLIHSKQQHRKISADRIRALNDFSANRQASISILFLFEHFSDRSVLQVSYEIGLNESQREKIYGYQIPVELDGNFEDEALEILIFLENLNIDTSDIEWHLLPYTKDQSIGKLANTVGVLFHNGKKKINERETFLELKYLSLVQQSTGNERLADVMREAHEIVANSHGSLDECLKNIGNSIAVALSCKSAFYHDKNRSKGWRAIINKSDDSDSEILLALNDEISNETEAKNKITTKRWEDEQHGEHETIHVPVVQRVFVLKNLRFQKSGDIEANLEIQPSDVVRFAFSNKRSTTYLQSQFSNSDSDVCRAVCDIIQEYSSARNFEDNYSIIDKHLRGIRYEPQSHPAEILKLLKSLSICFEDVFVVRFDREKDKNTFNQQSARGDTSLKDSYLNRVKSAYIDNFNNDEVDENNDRIYVGLDEYDNGYDFEFHLPGYHGKSSLYVVRYKGIEISESVYRALVHLFRELHVRHRRAEHSIDRKSYLTQVRHVLIHHVSAANRSGEILRKTWSKGQKSGFYWSSLQDDPIFPEIIDQCVWSLNQGSLLLHNGGFLLEELTIINRKPIQLLELINKTFRIFSYGREEKGIILESRVNGDPPSVINGDTSLMGIVFLNLIDNAIKYSRHNRKIIWNLKFKEKSYEFSIKNDSPALSQNVAQQLIDNIKRGDQKDRLNSRRGTGLGLPVANKILHAHSASCELKLKSLLHDPDLKSSSNSFSFEMPYLTGSTSERRQ